jgi:SAM-dependent methyltransferase
VNCFRAFPDSAFVFGRYRGIDASGNPVPVQRELGTLDNYYFQLLHGNFIGMHATVMYSKERLEKVGGFNIELRAAEDYELYLRLARDREIKQHGWLVAEYRRHDGNMTGDAALMLRAVLRVCDMELAHIRNPRQAESLRAGKSFYTHYYGNKMIDAWKERRDADGLIQLLRWYPVGLFRRAGRSLINRITPVHNAPRIDFGSLRRLTPVSRDFGYERGKPIDRRYIESFLSGYASDIRGVVLEIGDDTYSRRFGAGRVVEQEVLHVNENNPMATTVANLEDAPQIPSSRFDCIVFTQTLHLIYNVKAALATLHRILKNNGTLLMSVPGISQICHDASYPDSDSWRFTKGSISRLAEEVFVGGSVEVRTYGNVLAASSFLYGIAAQELTSKELDFCDDDYPLLICVRAQKREPGNDQAQ